MTVQPSGYPCPNCGLNTFAPEFSDEDGWQKCRNCGWEDVC